MTINAKEKRMAYEMFGMMGRVLNFAEYFASEDNKALFTVMNEYLKGYFQELLYQKKSGQDSHNCECMKETDPPIMKSSYLTEGPSYDRFRSYLEAENDVYEAVVAEKDVIMVRVAISQFEKSFWELEELLSTEDVDESGTTSIEALVNKKRIRVYADLFASPTHRGVVEMYMRRSRELRTLLSELEDGVPAEEIQWKRYRAMRRVAKQMRNMP